MRPLFDSNVLIRALNGVATPRSHLLLLDWQEPSISTITWIEVMVGATSQNEQRTRAFLSWFLVCELTTEVADIAARMRRTMRLKLPDAVIYATALATGRTLVTYNVRDFPEGTESVMIPSEVSFGQ